jgi:hypothetical protein
VPLFTSTLQTHDLTPPIATFELHSDAHAAGAGFTLALSI